MNNLMFFCDFVQLDWTAIGTIGLAIAAFWTIRSQSKQFNKLRVDDNERAYKTSSVTLIIEFDKQFDDLANERVQIAKIIFEKKILSNGLDADMFNKKLEDIYDFFDTVGYFVQHNYIKAEIAHLYFYYWFSNYYEFFKKYKIKSLTEYNDAVWNNMEALSGHLNKIESEQLKKAVKQITKEDLEKFFKNELSMKS